MGRWCCRMCAVLAWFAAVIVLCDPSPAVAQTSWERQIQLIPQSEAFMERDTPLDLLGLRKPEPGGLR